MTLLFFGLMLWLFASIPLGILVGRFLADPSNVDPPSHH